VQGSDRVSAIASAWVIALPCARARAHAPSPSAAAVAVMPASCSEPIVGHSAIADRSLIASSAP
jgi:hypothetical protein